MRMNLISAAMLVLTACQNQPDNVTITNVSDNVANGIDMTAIPEDSDAVALDNGGGNVTEVPLVTDGWIGRWNGPEGLFLDIKAGDTPGRYRMTIKDSLDSQASYAGIGEDATIRFSRSGKGEIIRVGTGKETGYKWLAAKTDCLIVVSGKEGYCR